jgi:superoxide dismutase, Fe-Mn family
MFKSKDYKGLMGTPGFSDALLTDHFTLYDGYVSNANKFVELLKTAVPGTPVFAELKRRFGWEFNGMRLHECHFRRHEPPRQPSGSRVPAA